MSRSLVFVLCLLQLALLIAANDYYSVVGPGTIRSNSKYNVAVTMHKARSILAKLVRQNLIDVSISGPSFNETKRVEVGHDSTEIVEFDVPTLAKGEYNLTAVGVEGVIFRNSTTLNVADNNPLIFIQTDKAIYKPGDRVQYRVLFLNESTRPAVVDEPITVTIIDQGGNRVKQVANITLTKGVYAGQLSLTAEPMYGKWVIKVTVAGAATETKFFEVAKYVLPKFEVKIEAMRDIAVQDGVIRAIVRAQHTHGQPLKGTANVSISPSYNSFRPSESAINQQKTIEIVGKGEVEFVIDAKDFSGHYTPPLMIFAEVTETLTGNKQNASVIINVHLQRLNLEAINNKATYRPGQPFIYEFVVKNLDGSPVQDNVTIAKLIFEPPNKFFNEDATAQPDKDTLQFEATLNKHGIARFNISLAANEDRFFSVKAAFANSSAYLGSIANFRPDIDSDEPLLIQVKTEKPKLEEDVEIEVKSDENIPYIVYTIVARGNIVKTEHVRVSRILTKHKSYTFKLTPTFAMVPQASIYVFYILNDDLHFVEETIHFEKQLENSIKITAPIEVEPNQEVKLQIKTEADSFVGLLAVDQSVLLLKAGNDLARDSIFNGLDKYKTTTPWQQGYGRYPGQASGLVTLTNAHYPYNSGEVVSVPVTVYNYLDKDCEVSIVLDNEYKEFEFVEATNHVTKRQADQGRYVRNISIPANSGNSVSFMIRPISAGASTLNIGALSPAAGDSISRPIRVQPTGELHRENREVLLILEESVEVSQELWIEVPGQTTMDYIEICVMGDILGPVFGNLRRLLDYDHNACGLNFLREQQVDYHGSFQEDGKNNDFSPGSHLALASFVLLAFLENEEFYSEFQQTIENGVRYVATGAYDDQYDDLHSQMLAANVLGRAGHSELGQIMEKLLARARKSDEQMWWVPEGSGSTAIQCTAYGLMALLDYKHAQESLPIVKWLVGQRNSFGGYDNSLDTVLALQALTKFAIKTGASDNTVIEYTTDGNLESKATLIVNPDGDARQCQSLESNTRVVQFYAAQKGMAILQLHYQYYAHPFNNKKKRQATNSTGHHYEKKPSFKITPNVKDTPAHLLELEICAEYAPPGCSNQTKNSFMVVMEVSMPSGFVGEVDSFDKMLALRDVNHVETKEKGTKVVIYFGPLKPGVVLCVPVEGARAHLVAEPKPARILMYDYYQTEHRATEYYEISTSFCDICEGAECGSDCDKKQST
ncbi:TepII [Drosophila busckii]|uniref:TEP1-F n=1 Tax=Drosophila busckii TaxID=30019 RepID=A0A0M4ES52_DROBS|nr:TepII [Drosophila busckii]